MVVEHEWQVGGTSNYGNAKAVYDSELGTGKLIETSKNCYTQDGTLVENQTSRVCNQTNDLTYKDEVGLIYVSDYMYRTLPEYWIITANNYTQDDVKNNNWLYLGITEWTISRSSDDYSFTRYVYYLGGPGRYNVYNNYGVRPVLYLSSDVKITKFLLTDLSHLLMLVITLIISKVIEFANFR